MTIRWLYIKKTVKKTLCIFEHMVYCFEFANLVFFFFFHQNVFFSSHTPWARSSFDDARVSQKTRSFSVNSVPVANFSFCQSFATSEFWSRSYVVCKVSSMHYILNIWVMFFFFIEFFRCFAAHIQFCLSNSWIDRLFSIICSSGMNKEK